MTTDLANGPLARYYGYGQAAGLRSEPLDACPTAALIGATPGCGLARGDDQHVRLEAFRERRQIPRRAAPPVAPTSSAGGEGRAMTDLTVGRLRRFYDYGLAAGLHGEPPRCLPVPARRPGQRRTQRVGARVARGTPAPPRSIIPRGVGKRVRTKEIQEPSGRPSPQRAGP